MCAFGAGTAPIMILTGAGGSLLSHSARRHLLKVSAVCVLLTGMISVARGVMFVQFPDMPRGVLPVLPLAAGRRRECKPRVSRPCRGGRFAYH